MPKRKNPKATKKYRDFHGRSPRYKTNQQFHVPQELVLLGEAVAIEYRCDKYNGGGDGTLAVYRHVFETPSIVAMDETAKKQLYIIGPEIIVTDAGIEN